MNSLELYIQKHGLDPVATMNRLTDAGIISDNCVNASDVASIDCFHACLWLQKNP